MKIVQKILAVKIQNDSNKVALKVVNERRKCCIKLQKSDEISA